jgi:hypothetical protein
MFRLVIVGGPNRGSSFGLVEGENTIGRQNDNHIVLTSSKVSKRHCALLVDVGSTELFIRDEGSTNGTFVNGALARKQKLKIGDKLAVGDFVFEVMRIGPAPMVATSTSAPIVNDYVPVAPVEPVQVSAMSINPVPEPVEAPEDLPGKVAFMFEAKVMPAFYGYLLKSEYRSMVAILIFLCVVISVASAIIPVIDLADKSIQTESSIRAKILAREVADRFGPAIAAHAESQIDISLLESDDSVKLITIVNTDLQIIAPQSRLNQLFAGGVEAQLAVKMAKEFREGREKGMGTLIGDSLAVYIEPIKTIDPRQVKNQVAAMVIVSIDFSRNLISGNTDGIAYGTGLAVAGLIGILIFFILIRITFKPFEVLNDDLDQVLRGVIPKVTHEFKINELNNLWDNINSAAQRASKGGGSDGDSSDQLINWDFEFLSVRAMSDISQAGFIGFDGEMKMVALNSQFEEISGIRADSIGQAVQQIARDQSFVALVSEIRGRIQSSPSRSIQEEFEFSGVAYQAVGIGVGSVGTGGFAIVFTRKA